MTDSWIPVRDIPSEGVTLVLDEPAVWAAPLAEFAIPCKVLEPLRGEVFILPQQGEGLSGGCIVRGRLTGKVAMPCNRCAEDAVVSIDSRFESYEPFPGEQSDVAFTDTEDEELPDDVPDEAVVRLEKGVAQINPSALLWEEFVLSLPVKPLCDAGCKGLCPTCGINLNQHTCECVQEEGDPRLAVLRNLTLTKK